MVRGQNVRRPVRRRDHRHAGHVLPCRTETGRTWDANGAILALVEALIARTTELSWASASKRMGALDTLINAPVLTPYPEGQRCCFGGSSPW